ncbi:MAG: exodeoxyribonuclease VII small subunit [Gemmatimonadota bacterium]|nr:exodeoxyribonuclease VII small subunit [Gemmatimonadota bacterium]
MSFESELARIDAIVSELEHGDLELDRSLELFTEGVDRLRKAAAALGGIEARIKLLTEKSDGSFILSELDR